jgi:hypothetical protein
MTCKSLVVLSLLLALSEWSYGEGCVVWTTVAGSGCAAPDMPVAIVFDITTLNLIIADEDNHRILVVKTDGAGHAVGSVVTLAGRTVAGVADGYGTNAQFWQPSAMVFASATGFDSILVTDRYSGRIRRVNLATGFVETLAGFLGSGFVDGDISVAAFNGPCGIYVADDPSKIYIADGYNLRVRLLDLTAGKVSTLVELPAEKEMISIVAEQARSPPLFRGAVFILTRLSIFLFDTSSSNITKLVGEGTPFPLDGIPGGMERFGDEEIIFSTDTGIHRFFIRSQKLEDFEQWKVDRSLFKRSDPAALVQPAELTADAYGGLYVADFVGRKILYQRNLGAPITVLLGSDKRRVGKY